MVSISPIKAEQTVTKFTRRGIEVITGDNAVNAINRGSSSASASIPLNSGIFATNAKTPQTVQTAFEKLTTK